MRQLGEVRGSGRVEIERLLQVAASAFTGHRGHALGAMLGQDRSGTRTCRA